MKAWTISIMVICMMMVICAMMMPAMAEDFDRGDFYPQLAIVVDCNRLEDMQIIVCQDMNGNIWEFYDDTYTWEIGDIANLLMWSHDNIVEHDEIVEVYWTGYTEDIDNFFQTLQWH